MNAATRDRLVNLLARTTSEHDGEALVAARKANQLLGRLGLTWAEVVADRPPGPAARPRPPVGDPMNASLNPRPQYPPAQQWYFTPRQRIARGCMRYGLGGGLLTGTAITLFIAIGDDGFDVSDYELAGVGFVLPALLGLVLWVLLGGWLPKRRLTPDSRSRRPGQ